MAAPATAEAASPAGIEPAAAPTHVQWAEPAPLLTGLLRGTLKASGTANDPKIELNTERGEFLSAAEKGDRLVDRHPNQVFVLDHIAKPRIRDNILSPWRENIRELARSMEESSSSARLIANSARQQSAGIEQVAQALVSISNATNGIRFSQLERHTCAGSDTREANQLPTRR